MKTFKALISEVAEPKAGDEKRFKDKHVAAKIDHPSAEEDQFTAGKVKKKKNPASYEKGEDEAVYEEKDMSDAQLKKREEIVKAMKDDTAGFKKRYGDKWKSVMYATATKQAMQESVELDEAMQISHKAPHPAGGYYVVLTKPGKGQHVIRHLNKGKVKELGTVPSLGLAKKYIDMKSKGQDPKKMLAQGGCSINEEKILSELTAAEKKLINQMYDKKGNLTPIGKKVMDHGKPKSKLEGLDEGNMASAAKELEAYARKNGGIDKGDFMKAAVMMKKGQKPQLMKFVDNLDTEPREKILSVMQSHMKEEVELDEAVIDDLRSIVQSKSMKEVKFANGGKSKVDMFTASAMVKVHDALNKANQKKFADAINKDERMFMKMMDFAMSKVGK